MRARSATVAGVLSLATAVNAVGSAIINNNCNHDVYLWPVSVDESPSSPTIIKANGGSWSQTYKQCSSGGMSLKLSDNSDMSSGITQFEYTLGGSNIWYDLSNVNCLPFGSGTCPFMSTGMSLSSGSGCPTAKCTGGEETCHDAYTYPDDNWASLSCQPSENTVLELCSSSSGSSSGSSYNNAASGIIGQVTSMVGNIFGGGSNESPSSSYEAPSTPSTTETPTSTYVAPKETSTPAKAAPSPPANQGPGGAYNDHGEVGIAAVPSSYDVPSAAPTTQVPTQAKAQTTLITTQAPAQPNVAVVYETVTEMVATTTVVYQHKMAHKAKRDSAHPHARRHHHEA